MGKMKFYLYNIIQDIIEKDYVHNGIIEYRNLVLNAIEDYINREIENPLEQKHLNDDIENIYQELISEFDIRMNENFVHDKQDLKKFLEDLGIKPEHINKYFISDIRILGMWRKKLPKARIRSWIKNIVIPKHPELEYMRQTEIYAYENHHERCYLSLFEFKKGLDPIDSLNIKYYTIVADFEWNNDIEAQEEQQYLKQLNINYKIKSIDGGQYKVELTAEKEKLISYLVNVYGFTKIDAKNFIEQEINKNQEINEFQKGLDPIDSLGLRKYTIIVYADQFQSEWYNPIYQIIKYLTIYDLTYQVFNDKRLASKNNRQDMTYMLITGSKSNIINWLMHNFECNEKTAKIAFNHMKKNYENYLSEGCGCGGIKRPVTKPRPRPRPR